MSATHHGLFPVRFRQVVAKTAPVCKHAFEAISLMSATPRASTGTRVPSLWFNGSNSHIVQEQAGHPMEASGLSIGQAASCAFSSFFRLATFSSSSCLSELNDSAPTKYITTLLETAVLQETKASQSMSRLWQTLPINSQFLMERRGFLLWAHLFL